jgi:hypothetical protein
MTCQREPLTHPEWLESITPKPGQAAAPTKGAIALKSGATPVATSALLWGALGINPTNN